MVNKLLELVTPRKAVFILGEGVLIFCSVLLATKFLWRKEFADIWTVAHVAKMALITLVIQVSLYFNDLYEIRHGDDAAEVIQKMGCAIGGSCLLLAVMYFTFPSLILGDGVVIVSLFFLTVFLGSWRLLYALTVKKKILTERILVVGLGKLTNDIAGEIASRADIAYNIVAVATDVADPVLPEAFKNAEVKRGYDGLLAFVRERGIECIIAAFDERRGKFPTQDLLDCKVNGIEIHDGAAFYESLTGKLLIERLNPSWLIFSEGFKTTYLKRFSKRLLDLIFSISGLIILSPLIALTAALIKLESKGPIFFAQERVGRYEKEFTLYKFRSMRTDAEKDSGPVWAGQDDPRITRIGRFIRKTRIDEIPQLWNILKGEMSVVGPRPERRFFVEQLEKKIPFYSQRFCVKPGLTGWAQIMFSYGASAEDAAEKLRHELYYIKNVSLILDIVIILGTLKTVILRRGAQ